MAAWVEEHRFAQILARQLFSGEDRVVACFQRYSSSQISSRRVPAYEEAFAQRRTEFGRVVGDLKTNRVSGTLE